MTRKEPGLDAHEPLRRSNPGFFATSGVAVRTPRGWKEKEGVQQDSETANRGSTVPGGLGHRGRGSARSSNATRPMSGLKGRTQPIAANPVAVTRHFLVVDPNASCQCHQLSFFIHHMKQPNLRQVRGDGWDESSPRPGETSPRGQAS